MTAVEKIQQSAEDLSAKELDQLIESLLAARRAKEEELQEYKRRIDELDSGEVEPIPTSQVMAEAKAILNGGS